MRLGGRVAEGGHQPRLVAEKRRLGGVVFRAFGALLCALGVMAWAVPVWADGVERFDELPYGPSRWDRTTNAWTTVKGLSWEAFNARAGWVWEAENPALSIQSEKGDNNGFWRSSGPLTGGVQRVRVAFRQVLTAKADCDVRVNGNVVGNYVSTGDPNQVDICEWEAVDPETGVPFAGAFELGISNRVQGAGTVAFDDVEWMPYRLFVALDLKGTNVAYAGDGEFEQPEFDVEATIHGPDGVPEGVEGMWSIEPEFAGIANDWTGQHLTLIPALEDAGKTFELTYTAWLPAEPEDGDEAEGAGKEGEAEEAPERFSYTARTWMRVEEAVSPRFVDFEDMTTMIFSAEEQPVMLAGMPWNLANGRSSMTQDPKLGERSLRLRHSSTSAASFASPVFYSGIGTLGFHFANFHTNLGMTLKVQTRGEDDEEDAWADVPDGALSFYQQMDINDAPFRVDVQREGACAFRILSTASNGAVANIDNVRIRAFGETDPVLRWDGPTAAVSDEPWAGTFTYLYPTSDFEFGWTVTPPLSGLSATTNLEEGTLTFSLTPSDEDCGRHEFEAVVRAGPDGVPDQRRRVVLSVGAWPTFELAPVATTVSNVVDIWVTNVVLHGGVTDWSVAWSAVPEFKGTNSVHNKSRYRVLNIADDDGEHVVTAELSYEDKEKVTWSATQSVTIVVSGSSGGGGGGGGGATNEVWIVGLTTTNLCVTNGAANVPYRVFAVENLLAGPDETNWVWSGAATVTPEEDGGAFWLDIEMPAGVERRFFGVRAEPPDE